MRRFVQHVLPKGFGKMRHYGLLANRHRAANLKLSRRLLLPVTVAAADAGDESSAASASSMIEPAPMQHCPKCGDCRFITLELAKEVSVSCADTS